MGVGYGWGQKEPGVNETTVGETEPNKDDEDDRTERVGKVDGGDKKIF